MSQALALRALAAVAPAARSSFATMPQTPEGCVTACFALESFDRRRGLAIYALRVVNRTSSLLFCRTWVVCDDSNAVLADAAVFEVRALSNAVTRVAIWPRNYPSFDRAVAEVVGEGIECVVDAAAPARVVRRSAFVPAALASAALGLLAFGGAAALHAATPRISAFALPPQALSGSTVRAEYEASGAGALSYAVTSPDGRRLAGGNLAARSGEIAIPLSASSTPGGYAVQLTMSGALGSSRETRVLNAVSGEAQIGQISVHPVVAQPGERVEVSYTAAADGGYLRLLGGDGTVWAQKPYSRDGQTSFVIPPVGDANAMHVQLHVTRGASTADSMAGIAIAGAQAATAQAPAVAIAGDDAAGTASAADGAENGTFEVLDSTAHGGDPIRIKIISPRNAMHVALTDAQSHEVTGQDVGAQADVVILRAPAVTVPTRYTVVASFTDGFGQESVVQPVTILP